MTEGIQEYIMFDHAHIRAIHGTTLSNWIAKNASAVSLLQCSLPEALPFWSFWLP